MARFEERISMRILWRGGGRVAHLVYANPYKPEAIRTSNLTQSTHIFLFNIESPLGAKFLDNSADKFVCCSEGTFTNARKRQGWESQSGSKLSKSGLPLISRVRNL